MIWISALLLPWHSWEKLEKLLESKLGRKSFIKLLTHVKLKIAVVIVVVEFTTIFRSC